MDDYRARAKDYFRQMEGWHLYRRPTHWLILSLAVVSVMWAVSIGWLLLTADHGNVWTMKLFFAVIGEFAVLLLLSKLQDQKKARLIESVNARYSADLSTENECRALVLNCVMNRPASQFLHAAKDISEALALEKQFRRSNEIEDGFVMRRIYDPDSKPRLLAVTLGAITVFTALLMRSLPDGPPLFEILGDPGIHSLLTLLLIAAAVAFAMMVGIHVLWGAFSNLAAIWFAKTSWRKDSPIALEYLARDLVRFYKPALTELGASALGEGEGT